MSADIIKEFMVAMGFQVDQKSVDEVNKQFSSLEKTMNAFSKGFAENPGIKKFTEGITASLETLTPEIEAFCASTEAVVVGGVAAIGVAVVALGITMTAVLAKFMADMGSADIQVQLFARRMFTTVENARSLKAVMDTMGLESMEDLKDVAYNPELRNQFMALRELSSGLALSGESKEGLKNIRAVGFEFQKLGLIMNFFFQTLGGQLGKVLEGPLKDIKAVVGTFSETFRTIMPSFAHDLAGIVGIFAKLTDLVFKFFAILTGGQIRNTDSQLKGLMDSFGDFLDMINNILDAVNGLVNALLGIPDKAGQKYPGLQQQGGSSLVSGGDVYNTKQDTLTSLTLNTKKILDILTGAWNAFIGLIAPIRDWVLGKIGEAYKNPIVKAGIDYIFGSPAQASESPTTATKGSSHGKLSWGTRDKSTPAIDSFIANFTGKLHEAFQVTAAWAKTGHVSHGKLSWGTRDKSTPAIDSFIANFTGKLHEAFQVTAAWAKTGHVSHGSGLAFDIGLGGKSDSSIVALTKAALGTKGLRMLDLELPMARYSSILKQLSSQGVNYKGRLQDQSSQYTTGPNLHVGVQPVAQNVNIHVSGAGDPKKVAEVVRDVLNQQASKATRFQQGAYA